MKCLNSSKDIAESLRLLVTGGKYYKLLLSQYKRLFSPKLTYGVDVVSKTTEIAFGNLAK